MKKCLSLLIALTMIMSIVVFPVSTQAETVDIPEGATLIFAEDFEGGYASGNLLVDSATEVNITNTETGKKTMKFNYADTTKESVTVEAGPESFNTSKVLKINTTNTANMSGRIYLDEGNDISTTDASSPYYGKQIVVEFDVMNAGANGNTDNAFMQLRPSAGTSSTTPIFLGYNNAQIQYRQGIFTNSTAAEDEYKRDWYMAHQPYINTKSHKVKYVVEQNMTDFDSTRFYHDGTLVTKSASRTTTWNTGRVFKDFILNGNNFAVNGYTSASLKTSVDYGDLGALYSQTKGKTDGTASTIYIDNIKVYAIDPITFTGLSKDEGVNLEAGVVANFSQPFNATADTFAVSLLSDETNAWIDGAISEVVMSSDKKSATVKFDTTVLGDNKEFKLWVAEDLTSEAGAIYYKDLDGVKEGEEYVELAEFVTYEIIDIVEAPESIDSLIPSDPRTFDIKLSGAAESVTAVLEGSDVTAELRDSNTTIKIGFGATIVAGDLVVTATSAAGQELTVTIPVTLADGIIETELVNDNLEGYELGSMLAGATGTSYNHTASNVTISTSQAKNGNAATAFDADTNANEVEIVADPAGGSGKAIYIKNGNLGTNLTIAKNVTSTNTRGKILVYSTKFFIPETDNTAMQHGDSVYYNRHAGAGVEAYQRSSGTGLGNIYIAQGPWNAYNAKMNTNADGTYKFSRAQKTAVMEKGKWVTVTNVYDYTHAGTFADPDTVRLYVDGEPVGASLLGTNAPTTPVYDLYPEYYYGEYPVTGTETVGYATGTVSGSTNKYPETITAIRSNINVASAAAEGKTAGEYYIGGWYGFIAEDFTAEVSGNTTEYTPNQTVKVIFNSPVEEAQLAKLYVVNKATGAKVEDAAITLASGGYVAEVKLPESVSKDEVYTVVAPTTFHDVTFQPLVNNGDWTFDITIGEYVPFKGVADKTAITEFANGKTTTATVTFSKPVASTSGITVKDKDGVAVETGWTASLSSDAKSIALNFTNLETANYTVEFAGVKAEDGDAITNADEIKITITAKVSKIMLFEEDFEEGYTSDNWVEAGEAPNDKFAMYVPSGATAANNFIGVVDAPADKKVTGKALRMYGSKSEAKRSAVKALVETGIKQSDYPGKVIVYEGDIVAVATADGSQMFNPSFIAGTNTSTKFTLKYSSTTSFKYEGAYFEPKNTGSYATAEKAHWAAYNNKNASNAHIKFTVDQNNKLGTVRYYVNDVVADQSEYTYLTDHALYGQRKYDFPINSNSYTSPSVGNTFYGVLFYPKNSASADYDYYIDNLKIYLVDKFEITGVEGATQAFNAKNNVVKFNFNNKVLSLENAQANIVLKDAEGNTVENGLTLTTAEGGYQVVAQLNEDKIEGSKEYTIEVSPELRDEYGIGLAAEYDWYDYKSTGGSATIDGKDYTWVADGNGNVTAFNPYSTTVGNNFNASCYIRDREAMKLDTVLKTTKGTSLYAEATATNVADKNVTTTLTLTNPEDKELDVWYIVAAYGEYNEMLGCQAAATKVAAGDVEIININFNAKQTGINSVKVYIWDGYKTMVPYQDAESIFGE